MRYLSVCSGIEAASVAWHHLGWTPVAFSEIEPFPAAVLAHHYPNIPNYGDMTKHKEWPLEPGSIDLLVGGTPCQSFSVAGLRKGLHDPRGGLMLTYLEIARRLRPRWIVWENVPGVLSSNGGRDFGSFLGAMGELGYGVAYRVLDAQWCRTHGHPLAVPQRRRRVFVVGCLGDWERAAAVLFERESVQRDSAPRRAPRQGAPADAEAGARAGCWWDGGGCAGTLTKQNAGGAQRMPDKDNFGAVLQPVGYRWQNDRDGLVEDGTAPSCRASAGSSEFHEMNHPVVVQQPVAFSQNQREEVREVEVPGALAAEPGTHQQTYIAQPVPYDLFQITAPVNRQNRKPGDPCHTLARDNAAHAAVAFHPTQDPISSSESSHALGTGSKGGCATAAVAFANRTRDGIKVPEIMADGIVPALTNPGDGGRSDAINVAVTFTPGNLARGAGPSPNAEVAPTQRCSAGRGADDQRTCVAQAMTVRRLTPRECERLQGFPDDYTLIPWRKKPADQCPDGPRYKALGNSMAVNCMAWIGERIAAVEELQ